MLVCANCFNSATLAETINTLGTRGDCEGCGLTGVTVLHAWDLKDAFKPVIGLYPEELPGETYIPQIDSGFGGDSLSYLLQDQWPIFNEDFSLEKIDAILEQVDSDYDPTTEYAVHDLWYTGSDTYFRRLANALRHKHRFFLPKDDHELMGIDDILGDHLASMPIVELPETWYRARIHPYDRAFTPPKKYRKREMGAPHPELVMQGGRANPPGIAFLYLSSDERTATAEKRPTHGDFASIGRFQLRKRTVVLDLRHDLRSFDPFEHPDLESEIEARKLLRTFVAILSDPVRDEDHEVDYVVTQYLSEYVRSRGYTGFLFPSSVAAGTNLVLFDPGDARCTSVKQFKITGVDYHWEPAQPKRVSRVTTKKSDR